MQEFAYETLKSQFNFEETLTESANPYAAIYVTLPKDLVTIIKVLARKRVGGVLGPYVELTEVAGPLGEPWSTLENIYVRDYEENKILLPSMFYPGEVNVTYLSNSLTTSEDAAIPKLAEEAMYACMVYAILANRENTNPNLLQRLLIEKIDKLERSKSRLVFTNFSE